MFGGRVLDLGMRSAFGGFGGSQQWQPTLIAHEAVSVTDHVTNHPLTINDPVPIEMTLTAAASSQTAPALDVDKALSIDPPEGGGGGPPVTDTFTIEYDAVAGGWYNDSHGLVTAANWTDLLAGTGTYTHQIYGQNYIATQVVAGGAPPGAGTSYQSCSYLRWDTSSIPDDATITAAVLRVKIDTFSVAGVEFAYEFYDFGGGAVTTIGDWSIPNSGDAIAAFDPADVFTASTVCELPLTGLAGINKSGWTGLRSGYSSSSTPPSGDNYFDVIGEGAPGAVLSELDVTYVPAGAGGVDEAQPLDFDLVAPAEELTPVAETDAAQALVVTKPIVKTLTAATSSQAAQAVDVDKYVTIDLPDSLVTDEFDIAAGGNDGHGRYVNFGSFGWANVGSGAFADEYFGADWCSTEVSEHSSGSQFQVTCAYFRWDTSSIPDDATIVGAVLKVHVLSADDPADLTFGFDFYDYGGNPSTSGDWHRSSACDAVSAFDLDTLTVGAVSDIPLTGLTGISKTGYTGLRSGRCSDTDPGVVGQNYFHVASFDHASAPAPQLVVTYVLAGVGGGVDEAQPLDYELAAPAEELTPAAETDAAQALVATKPIVKSLTAAASSQSAQALAYVKPIVKTLVAAASSQAAQTLTKYKPKTLTSGAEADAAQTLSFTKPIYKALVAAASSQAAQALVAYKPKTLVAGSSSQAAQALSVTKLILKTLVAAASSQAAQALSYVKPILKALAAASSSQAAQALSYVKQIVKALTAAASTQAAQTLVTTGSRTLGAATELGASQALAKSKRLSVGTSTSTQAAQALLVTKPIFKLLASTSSSNVARPLSVTHVMYRSLTATSSSQQAQALTARKQATLIRAESPNAAVQLAQSLTRSLAPATSSNAAYAVTWESGAQDVLVAPATETATSLTLSPAWLLTLVPAGELDEARRALTRPDALPPTGSQTTTAGRTSQLTSQPAASRTSAQPLGGTQAGPGGSRTHAQPVGRTATDL